MSYTCPYCQITSHNPNDEQHKYCRNCHKFEDEPRVTAEQQARDMLERMNIDDAQSFTAGDLIELANLISEVNAYRRSKPTDRLDVFESEDTQP